MKGFETNCSWMKIEITDSPFSRFVYKPLNNKVLCGTAGGMTSSDGPMGPLWAGDKTSPGLAGQRLCVGSVGYCWRKLKCLYNDFFVMYCGRV